MRYASILWMCPIFFLNTSHIFAFVLIIHLINVKYQGGFINTRRNKAFGVLSNLLINISRLLPDDIFLLVYPIHLSAVH